MPRRLPEKRFGRGERRERKFRPMRSYVLDTPSRPVPVSNGEEHEVTIDAVGRKGDGIAKIQGFTIFVPNAKLGEHIKIKITSVRGNFAVAAKVE